MQVIFVVPPTLGEKYEDGDSMEYLGLGYVAAVAREHNYTAHILDCRFENIGCEDAAHRLHTLNPHVVGITAPFAIDLTSAVKLSQRLRNIGYGGLIMVGGHSPTFTYQTLLSQFPSIDVVVRGEGEDTFLELLQKLDKGLDWRQTPGIAYRENDQVVATAPRPLVTDLDSLPFPARDNLATNGTPSSALFAQDMGLAPGGAILSSRGCPFHCVYCSVQAFYGSFPGSRWRARSATNVINEIAYLVEKWNYRMFRFSDDNFFGSCRKGKVRAKKIADLLIEKDLSIDFVIECCVTDVELSLFSHLKRAGLTQVNLGIETGVPRILKSFNKHATVEQNKKAISILKELSIKVHPNFILIEPKTTLPELRQNLDFFKETKLYREPNAFASIFTNRLGLFAGTPIQESYQAAGKTKPSLFPGLTEEDQCITSRIGAIMHYSIQDPGTVQFLQLHDPVIRKLMRRDSYLTKLQRQLYRSTMVSATDVLLTNTQDNGTAILPIIEQWRTNVGLLALRLYEKALTHAEQRDITDESIKQLIEKLFAEIDRYDTLYFGTTVDEVDKNFKQEEDH